MGGQIIDASIVATPKQPNTDDEKRDIKEGRIPPQWAKKSAKLRQKDRDARWTVKYTKAKPSADGAPRVDLAIPAFFYKNHIGIDRRHHLIRRWRVTDAARHDGTLLAELIDPNNTAYRSQANEKFLAGRLLRSQIHRKKLNPGQTNAAPHRPGQCPQIGSARGSRAYLCPSERANGPVHPHHWPRPCDNQNRLANLLYNMQRMVWRPQGIRANVHDPGCRSQPSPRPTPSRYHPIADAAKFPVLPPQNAVFRGFHLETFKNRSAGGDLFYRVGNFKHSGS